MAVPESTALFRGVISAFWTLRLQSIFWASRDAGARIKQVAIDAVAHKSFTRFIVFFSLMVRRRKCAKSAKNLYAFVKTKAQNND